MKTLNRHIAALLGVLALASCSLDELHLPDQGREVEFIMRPTSFSGIDVASASTKALSADQLTEVEGRIASLYFLVFGEDGNRLEDLSGALDPASAVSRTLYGRGPLTVCYIANVPYSYVSQLTHIDRLQDTPLPITYASHSQTGHVGVPDMTLDLDRNGTDESKVQCFPMFGQVTFPGAESVDNQVEVPLQRLFAKVIVNLKADMDQSSWINMNPPAIDISSYTIVNLPNKVALSAALGDGDAVIEESAWIRDAASFMPEIRTDFDPVVRVADDIVSIGGLISSTPVEILTCYVPEYALRPSGTNVGNDQRIKPSLVASDKYPVQLVLEGTAFQEDIVDVPVKYSIHLGENAYDSFSLRRNTAYSNNMTVYGTLDAILGTDHRVEAWGYNLADPDNSGTDVPANCYIISKPGRYVLPLYKGNDTGQVISGATSVEVVDINGSASNIITDKVLTIDESGRPCVVFDTNISATDDDVITPTTVAEGNKLLIVRNSSGQILWSWHLWYCADGRRPDNQDLNNVYPTTNAVVMNRALGATNRVGIEQVIPLLGAINLAQWTDGFYYQWGRKDPLLSSGNTTASGATYEKSVQNPRTFYTDWTGSYSGSGWAGTKTVNDPCPPGYKVPSNAIWRATQSSSTGMEDIVEAIGNIIPGFDGYPYNVNASLDVSQNIMYPYSGYLENGILSGVSSKPFANRVATEAPVTGMEIRVIFSGTDHVYSGELWSNAGALYFSRSKTDITRSDIFVKINNSWYPRQPDNNNPNGYTVGNIESSILGSFGTGWLDILAKVAVQGVLDLLRSTLGFTIDGVIESTLESLITVKHEYDPKLHTDSDAIPSSHGAHVRCVREDSPVQ